MAEKYILIRVSNGKNKVFDYRWDLRQKGFEFEEKSYGRSYYYKKFNPQDVLGMNKIKLFCKKNKLTYTKVSSDYLRSNDYRKTFFANNKGVSKGRYFCAYCGHIMPRKDVTVDHIFSLKHTEKSKRLQREAKWIFGITDLNSYRNLCAACMDCNKKKGTKAGIWVLKGFLGKSVHLWYIRKALKMGFYILGVVVLLVMLYRYGLDVLAMGR